MQIKSFIDSLVKKVADKAQTILKDDSSEKHSINELVTFIKEDNSTNKTSKTLLGITYNQYVLKKDNLHILLETKGTTIEKVLSLKIYSNDYAILNYQSYDSKLSLDKGIKIPLQLTH